MNKKYLSAVFAGALFMTGCSAGSTSSSTGSASVATADDPAVKSEGVMTYAEFAAAEVQTEVTVEAYVQAKQGWWENDGVGNASIYTQDADGAYFMYNLPMSEEDYDKLVEGQKIKVTGYKAEWSGEVEIIDGQMEIEEGNYIVAATDVTAYLGTDDLAEYINRKVSFTGLQVAEAEEGSDVGFKYSWDGSGSEGDDLYFNVTDGTNTYSFTVESYLCGSDTDVYKAVKELKVGDTIDCEGFLYWYEGANPHITSVTVK